MNVGGRELESERGVYQDCSRVVVYDDNKFDY